MSDSDEECLKEMLGGITFDVDWQEEATTKDDDDMLTPGLVHPKQRKIQPSTTTSRVTNPVSYHSKEITDDDSIFHYAYKCSGYCTPDGRVELPPLQVVDMGEGRGNGLVATQAIPRGTVIYTERAAAATQLPSPVPILQACQCCFRSLEPLPLAKCSEKPLPCADLWPVPPLDFVGEQSGLLLVDKHGRVQCKNCQALFCNQYCHTKLHEEYSSCCSLTRCCVQQAFTLSSTLCSDMMSVSVQAPVALAARLFCHMVHYYRSHDASLEGHFLSGFCGSADNLDALELGTPTKNHDDHYTYTLAPFYDSLTTILDITTPTERQVLSLELLHTVAAKAARNGFGMLTQSPFKAYYAGLLRKSDGRDSLQHQERMKQVAQALFGKEQLERGMDREIEERVAPEICAVFPLTARCNNSCAPNAEVHSQEFVDAHIDVVALRDIAPGEEVLISYIGVGSGRVGKKSTNQRRRELQSKYLFVCDCSLCTELTTS